VVTGYSRDDLIEIYELRELLENAAVRAAAQSMTEPDRVRLARIAQESRRLRDGPNQSGPNQSGPNQSGADQSGTDRTELAALLTEFDALLYDQVLNHRIQALIENLRAHLTRIGQLTTELPGRIDASVDEHDRIVEAIAARDPELAEQRMREHIRSVRDAQLRALEEVADHA
jgi:DNA-binding GntR family transcriptional regulator